MERRRKKKLNKNSIQSSESAIPINTKDFLRKICFKRAATVDMTQYGFITDSKVNPVNLLLKPLREKLEKICGPREVNLKKSAAAKKPQNTTTERRQHVLMYKSCENKSRPPVSPRTYKAAAPRQTKQKVVVKTITGPPPSPQPIIKNRRTRVTFEEPLITLKEYTKSSHRLDRW